jgi:hypothetical protein
VTRSLPDTEEDVVDNEDVVDDEDVEGEPLHALRVRAVTATAADNERREERRTTALSVPAPGSSTRLPHP